MAIYSRSQEYKHDAPASELYPSSIVNSFRHPPEAVNFRPKPDLGGRRQTPGLTLKTDDDGNQYRSLAGASCLYDYRFKIERRTKITPAMHCLRNINSFFVFTESDHNEHGDENSLLCVCPGVTQCDRKRRAICCRVYPFEPFLDKKGNLLGLTFNFTPGHDCPLMKKKNLKLKLTYLMNCHWLVL